MDDANGLLSPSASTKRGRDPIFAMLSKCQAAAAAGAEVINGTIGALLEDDGTLAINATYVDAIKASNALDVAAYSPLSGLPDFNDLLVELALGPERPSLLRHVEARAMATPGGGGALRLTAANLVQPGGVVLMRDRHWGPYLGFLGEAGLQRRTWPLLGPHGKDVDVAGFSAVLNATVTEQTQVLVWLNDPAHNPTGLSLCAESRADLLEAVVHSALEHPNVGHSLMIDAAYTLYAEEPHGWATTLAESMDAGMMWPENLMLLWAVSLSKSHTAYGARCGGLVALHPEGEALDRVYEAFAVTGRGTWSGPPRAPQTAAVGVHRDAEQATAWGQRLDDLTEVLARRRAALVAATAARKVPLNPTHDGFFAWLEHERASDIVDFCASRHVYLVALDGGVRIGLCAMPEACMERVADVMAEALEVVG